MSSSLSPAAQRVQAALHALNFAYQVIELPESTRSAQEAAQAIGTSVGQIVKSLLFRARQSGRAVLVLASGSNRVDEKKLATLLGEKVEKADADFVRQQTGFAIGGVPPLAHLQKLIAFIDEDLLQYDEVWAAAGTPHAVFRLHPHDLERMSGGTICALKQESKS